jgi:glycosyltransferase involved in cell wall biosynthesis
MFRPSQRSLTPGGSVRRYPSVSLVIPAFNEEERIERCLSAALSQTMPAAEIIVVDNNSTDTTVERVQRLASRHPEARVRVIAQTAHQGITPTRDTGFAAATGEVVGRIDADTTLAPDWVARVASIMRDAPVGAVSGPVTYYDLPLPGLTRLSDDLARRLLRRIGRRYPFLLGSNMAIRASAWRAVAAQTCLDRADEFHEDLDLALHLYEAGVAIGYDSSMRASVSARRLSGSPESFRAYTGRFERTYASHGVDLWHLRIPRMLLQSLYRWMQVARSLAPASWTPVPA